VEPTTAGRVSVGVLVTLGGFLGLREWVAAGLAGAGLAEDEWWATATAAWVTLGLRATAAVAGGLIAGAGRAGGWMSGALAGGVAGGLLLAADMTARPSGPGTVAYLSAAAVAAAGLLAGFIGSLTWPAPIDLPKPHAGSRGSSLLRLAQELDEARKGRPTSWLRIIIGACVAFCGIVGADVLRTGLSASSGGTLHMGSSFHAPIVCLELAAAVVFFGGTAAGASTGAGTRHGLLAGFAAAAGAVALTVTNTQSIFPAVEGFFWVIGVPTENIRHTTSLAELFVAVWAVCAVGGWFGGQLLPPLATPDQLRKIGGGDNAVVQVD
jgi:hypothetical protein